jgi:GDSL-like Lipase/Acylhydrolase family
MDTGKRMGYHLATATLGPLLLLQGRHVRRVTPRLAEAAGPRDGTAGDGPPLRLLIVGDSAAAGVGVPVQGRALSGQLVAALAATHRVSWRLIARTGWTTRDLLVQIEAEPAARFDVAVTSLGINETTGGVPPARWLRDQAALVALLSQSYRSSFRDAADALAKHVGARLFAMRVRPWGHTLGTGGDAFHSAICDLGAGGGLFRVGNPHEPLVDAHTFQQEWQMLA